MGAIGAATDISHDALNLGQSAIDAGVETTHASLDNALSAYQGALNFGQDLAESALDTSGQSADRVAQFATTALDTVTGNTGTFLDFAESLFGKALTAQSDLTHDSISGLSSLTAQTTATSDDRLQKVIIYAIVAIAVVLVVPRIFK
jgi:hypothetical protein